MLELLLLRHAKSSLAETGVADAARPLNERGREAAQAMGRMIAAKRLVPEMVLCSPARRTQETWKIASAGMRPAPAFQLSDGLYDFGNGGSLLHILHASGLKTKRLLLVGHNPSLEGLAMRLAGSGDSKLIDRLEKKFPTAALAVLGFEAGDWHEIAEKKGKLKHFIRPKDIMAESGKD